MVDPEWEKSREEIARVHVRLKHIGSNWSYRAIECHPTEPIPQAMLDYDYFPIHRGIVVLANDVPRCVSSSFSLAEAAGLLNAEYAVLVLQRRGFVLEREMDWQI